MVLAVVERQRQHRQRHIVRLQPEIVCHADRSEPHVGVAQHYAFGSPGRTAGIEDRCQFGGISLRRREWFVMVICQGNCFVFREKPATGGHVSRLKAVQPCLRSEQQFRAAISKDMCHLRSLQQRVDRDMHQPRPRGCQRQQAGQLALRRPARYPRARRRSPCPSGSTCISWRYVRGAWVHAEFATEGESAPPKPPGLPLTLELPP